jgi:Ca2+-binding RTX toxin-like protein
MASPNLRAGSFTVSKSTVAPGESITVSYSITNIDNGLATGFWTGIFRSADSIISNNGSDPFLAGKFTSQLISGGGFFDSQVVTVPTTPGNYWIGAYVDYIGQVPESAEGDNASNAVLVTVMTPVPTVSISGAPAVNEGSTLSYTVTRSGGDTSQPLTVFYSTGGQATSGSDYSTPSGSVTIAAGSLTASINIATTADHIDDAINDETLTLTLAGSSAYNLGTSTATGTIHDVDSPSLSTVSISGTPAANEGGTLTFTVTRSGGDTSQPLTVFYSTGGQATSGSDYSTPSGSVTIAAGSLTAPINITTVADHFDDPINDETLTLTLAGSSAYNLGTSTAAGTIHDIDSPSLSTVSISGTPAANEGGTLTFTVTRNGGDTSQPLTVFYSTNGQAISGSDYSTPSGSVTIAAGSLTTPINITTIADHFDDPINDETLTLTLTGSSAYNLGTSTATGTIHDIDSPLPQVSISAATTKVTEGGELQYHVKISSTPTQPITVLYTLSGSADYTSAPSGSVTFTAGQTDQLISVQTRPDADQDNETLTVTLQSSSQYVLGTASATSTVTDISHLGGQIFVEGGDVTPINPLFGHLFLVYQTTANEEYIIRGGPSTPTPQSPQYGLLDVENSWLLSESADSHNNTHGRTELDLGGRDASDVWSVMVQVAEQIDQHGFFYSPDFPFQNSNNVVGTLLHAVDSHPQLPGPILFTYPTTDVLDMSYRLVGKAHDDHLSGGPRSDRLEGGDGNDTYYFSRNSGNDTIFDTGGTDTIYYHGDALASGSSVVPNSFGLSGDLIGGLSGPVRNGNDLLLTFHSGTSITVENYFSSSGTNRVERFIDGNESAVGLNTFDGPDTVYSFIVGTGDLTPLVGVGGSQSYVAALAGSNSNALDDGDISTSLNSASAFDGSSATLDSFAMSDSPAAMLTSAAQSESSFDDWLFGSDGADTLVAHDGDDVLFGGAGNDQLAGGAGNDMLDGGAGADRLDGGVDTANSGGLGDTAIYAFAPSGVSASLATGSGTRGDAAGDTLIAIENLVGSEYADDLTGNAATNLILGLGGDDILNGGAGADGIDGGLGNDILIGGAGNDFLDGGDGSDTAVFSGVRSAYSIAHVGNSLQVSGPDGLDTLTNVERLAFDDITIPSGSTPYDFNADATSDVFWRNNSTGHVGTWEMRNNVPTWHDLGGSGADYKVAGIGDFNGDGTADLFWRNDSTGHVGIWEMHNNVQTWRDMGLSSGVDYKVVGVGDLNGDGTADLFWRNDSTGHVGIWEMHNNIQTWRDMGLSSGVDFKVAGIGDYNGDGTSDIVWRNDPTGHVGIWEMHNNVQTWHDLGLSSGVDFKVAGIGDYNGDGTSDVFWRNNPTGHVGIWEMHNNAPTWHDLGLSSGTDHLFIV